MDQYEFGQIRLKAACVPRIMGFLNGVSIATVIFPSLQVIILWWSTRPWPTCGGGGLEGAVRLCVVLHSTINIYLHRVVQ